MTHFRLIIEYDGTRFQGWQVQPGRRTVQGELESAAGRLLGHPVRMMAAGRTDAGVHASGQVVSFKTEREIEPAIVLRALNGITGRDISVLSASIADERFDPRRHARARRYVYHIWNRPIRSPFWQRYAWHVRQPLAVEAMSEAARVLVGEHDFTSFRAADCDTAHPVRRVYRSEVSRAGELVRYEIEATAFLRHMVRNIAGTLVEIGLGKRPASDMPALLAARNRHLAGATAPAHGLCLAEVRY